VEPAVLLRRVGAMIYDGLLMLAVWMFTLLPLVMISNAAVSGPFVRALLFLELYGFFAWFWMRRGQTLGMLAWRLQIHNAGRPFTLGQATRRFLGGLAGFGCLGLGYLWILIDPARRSWSDIVSASQVVHVPKAPG
jgi:uncharacterized RDD family membrane protein YckC